MGPADAVRTCFQKYVDFSGRAGRPEFWWWVVFYIVVSIVAGIIDSAVRTTYVFQGLAGLAFFLPTLAVDVRRLHDTGRSGWWIFIVLIPLIGVIWLIVLWASKGDAGVNKHGAPTDAMPATA